MRPDDIDFEIFDESNPEFWDQFRRFSFEAIRSGRKRFSARAVFQRMRWETEIDSGGTFKVNNNWCAFYSRKFMREYPEYKGFFETRNRRTKAVIL